MTLPRDAVIGAALLDHDPIVAVHITRSAGSVDLIAYHRGPVPPATDRLISSQLADHAAGETSRPTVTAINASVRTTWTYRDLDSMHEMTRRAESGRHRFDLDPSQVHLLPDFQPLACLARGHILGDKSGELVFLQRRLGRYPTALTHALAARLWELGPLLEQTRTAALLGDIVGTAAGLSRSLDLAAHALHGQARQWPPPATELLTSAARLCCSPRQFIAVASEALAHLGQRPASLLAATNRCSTALDAVLAVCHTEDRG